MLGADRELGGGGPANRITRCDADSSESTFAARTLSFLSLPEPFDAPPKSFLKLPKQRGAGALLPRALRPVTRAAAKTGLLLPWLVARATVLAVLLATRKTTI